MSKLSLKDITTDYQYNILSSLSIEHLNKKCYYNADHTILYSLKEAWLHNIERFINGKDAICYTPITIISDEAKEVWYNFEKEKILHEVLL
jgi:hypothetical protein